MAEFYANVFSDESYLSQWKNHLQANAYTTDIVNAIKSQTDDSQRNNQVMLNVINNQKRIIEKNLLSLQTSTVQVIKESTEKIVGTIHKDVVGTIHEDLSLLSSHIANGFSSFYRQISNLSDTMSSINWNTSVFIEQQRISNLLMHNVAELLRIPDFQKEDTILNRV